LLDSFHPTALALLAALNIAIARTFYRSVLLRLGAGTTALASGIISLGLIWSYYFYTGTVDSWPLQGIAWFVIVGMLGGVGGRYLNFFSMKELGLARTSVLMQTSIIWSTGLAIVLLGEQVNLTIGAGTAAIMIGSILLVYKGGSELKEVPFSYYFIPVVAAFLLGLSHLLRKYGYNWIDSATFGLSISNTVSVMTMIAILPFTNEGIPKTWGWRPIFFIVAGAVFNALSALFFWTAVQRGEIVQVVPITRISVLMMIFTSWLFFRKQERVTARVVYGGVLSVAGVFLVVWGK
jgi:uncharacterized membrane protein